MIIKNRPGHWFFDGDDLCELGIYFNSIRIYSESRGRIKKVYSGLNLHAFVGKILLGVAKSKGYVEPTVDQVPSVTEGNPTYYINTWTLTAATST